MEVQSLTEEATMSSPLPTWSNEQLSNIVSQEFSKDLVANYPFIVQTDDKADFKFDDFTEEAEDLPTWVYALVGILVGVGIVVVLLGTWLFYWLRQRRQKESYNDPESTSPPDVQKKHSFSSTCAAVSAKQGDLDGSTCWDSGCPDATHRHTRTSTISDTSPTMTETSITAASMGLRNSSATDRDIPQISDSISPSDPCPFPSITAMAVNTRDASRGDGCSIFELPCKLTYLAAKDTGD